MGNSHSINSVHSKLHCYLILLIAFFLPIAHFVPFCTALLLLNWLVEGDFKSKFQAIAKNKTALLFLLFYFLFLLGLLGTQNINAGLFDIEVKLSLLIFPIVLSSRPVQSIQIKNIFTAFIVGCLISSVIMLSTALYQFFIYGAHHFFYEKFSIFMHPGYLSMYLNVVLMLLMMNILTPGKYSLLTKKYVAILILFFSFINVLLSSKLGLLTTLLLYLGFLAFYVINRKKYIFGILGLLIMVLSIYAVMNFVPEVAGRINYAASVVSSDTIDQTESESTAVRLLIWKAARTIIGDNFVLGVGTGDVKDELMKEYEKRGMTGAIKYRLNAHNQFIQTFISLGAIGFLVLIACFCIPFIQGIKNGNYIYVLFIMIVVLNFTVESMLEVQAGVMFYAFFNSLFCFQKLNE